MEPDGRRRCNDAMPFTTRAASISDAAELAELLTRCRYRYLGRASGMEAKPAFTIWAKRIAN